VKQWQLLEWCATWRQGLPPFLEEEIVEPELTTFWVLKLFALQNLFKCCYLSNLEKKVKKNKKNSFFSIFFLK